MDWLITFFDELIAQLNYFGLLFLAVIMIPNIVYAVKSEGSEGGYHNKAAVVFEQIGRYGCMIFTVVQIPYACLGFWFDHAFTVYLIVSGSICAVYCLLWIVCWKRDDMFRAISLSVLPSAFFLFGSVAAANFPLMAFALIFAPSHILISCKNARAAGAV